VYIGVKSKHTVSKTAKSPPKKYAHQIRTAYTPKNYRKGTYYYHFTTITFYLYIKPYAPMQKSDKAKITQNAKAAQSSTKNYKRRVVHTDTIRKDGARFYALGLTLPEISKQIDVPLRTLERWQTDDRWTLLRNSEPIKDLVCDLYDNGLTKQDISDKLNLSYTTIYRYIKAYELEQAAPPKRKK
jgi:Homeodomain-like domain